MSWRRSTVSDCGTHHCLGREPLYEVRFDQVLPFHEPGLAPVQRGGVAWHIGPDGVAAYEPRFRRTFGFYEGRAAVVGEQGWHHIDPHGEALYDARYDWCGNYQGDRCAVREQGGRYLHLDEAGRPEYDERWRYAGDYRHGIAVVQGDDGRSTHIDREGRLLHERWFVDLDVFHKGLARARDQGGWTHVGSDGRPAYERRFAMVEPFYNGQARVETNDGGLEVIDYTGTTLVVLRAPLRDEFHALSADMVGFWRTRTIETAARCGLVDVLPATTAEVAARCELSEDGAARLLDALGEMGLVGQDVDERWVCTPRGEYLSAAHPQSLAGAVLELSGPLLQRWSRLEDSLRGLQPSGPPIFEEITRAPERQHRHHRMLESYAAHDYAELVEHLPIYSGDVVLDAGGGSGWLAQRIQSEHPESEVLMGDLPSVLAASSVEGIRSVDLDLLEPWPVEVDVVILARVLHDWPDEVALRILGRARAALRPGGRLAVLEYLRPDDGFEGALCDLHLLAVTGGQERRRRHWLGLVERGGFQVDAVVAGPSVPSL
ncbi:MAG: methyltransferase, partial [Myxococcales bacterium]|nr:methyltransferase [Myxococcales bacterium]